MKERRPFRPRRGRLGHLPQGGKRECPRFPRGGSGRRPIGGSPSRKAGHRNSFIGRRGLHSFLLSPPASAAALPWHQLQAPGFRGLPRIAGGAHPPPHGLEASKLPLQFPIPYVFRMIHAPFPLFQPMPALAKRCELCHNINYENVGSPRKAGADFDRG